MSSPIILPGTRIASVGVATFVVSLCIVLCLILLIISRLMRRPWIGILGLGLVISVILAFAITPKASTDDDTTITTNTMNLLTLPTSSYTRTLYGTTIFLIISLFAAGIAIAIVHSNGLVARRIH
jgi:hypothetical protein